MKKVFVNGDFFVIHPGHERFLRVASSFGDYLHVGVNNTRPTVNYKTPIQRVELIQNLKLPNSNIFVVEDHLKNIITRIKPDIIVKGSEHRKSFNPEIDWIKDWGGKLVFASGEISDFSDLTREDLVHNQFDFVLVRDYMRRHKCSWDHLDLVLDKFKTKKVLVVGDLIVDEYITCDALGMSQEDPTIVVSPNAHDKYLGGAGIVASHVSGLGAKVKFLTIAGLDDGSKFASNKLKEYGVLANIIFDDTRPTTLKQRFRVANKTLLRVSHLRRHDASSEIENSIYEQIKTIVDDIDLLILSDFNYGCLSRSLINKILDLVDKKKIFIAADSQSSSQSGDIAKFHGVSLITPTEYEARVSLKNDQSGLQHVANSLSEITNCNSILLTLGRSGVLVNSRISDESDLFSDNLPALNVNPLDPSGAGDSMLVAAALSMCSGASVFQAAFIASIVSAIQVSRLGNTPILLKEVEDAISRAI
jgi:rfaE bifunctional protein kinase chain/domain